ncbi:alkaline phosphatase D family protein [Pseudoalteromonas sp. Of7M-16]|uniref:alkaline phosphatase D family protein n=1 Tax=Pseudoalteromonas sp. Of7M-16 TaxID=2917756 RepID=UPI001EF433FC|nr:alkaline phosphatase D family protein [Pseudoalteromonas sp. Of7M-16]MCG7546403.1 alkaline phosphatase D family protein [Pseudoalteromonas sp. Of7M-16]
MTHLPSPNQYESSLPKLKSMCIVGHTTDTTTKIWVRTFQPGQWCLVLVNEANIQQVKGTLNAFTSHPDDACFSASGIVKATLNTDEKYDNCECVTIENLTPNTRYYYYLFAYGDTYDQLPRKIERGMAIEHAFCTDEASPHWQNFSFGFYSCHDPFGHRSISDGLWPDFGEILEDKNTRFVIGGGDQVYCDTHGKRSRRQAKKQKPIIEDLWVWLSKHKNDLYNAYMEGEELNTEGVIDYLAKLYRIYYRVYWNFDSLRTVYCSYPQYMMWDDHEIMDGWGSLTRDQRIDKLSNFWQDDEDHINSKIARLAYQAAKRAYLDYQHLHNPDTNVSNRQYDIVDKQQQWDYGFTKGPIGVYMLDTRSHHDVEHQADGARLLGPEQMTRFLQWLNTTAASGVKALFIVTAVPVVHWNDTVMNNMDLLLKIFGAMDDAIDEWGNETNITERNNLLEQIFKASHANQIPITFLSGDVHCSSAFKLKSTNYKYAKVMNITSSAISRKPPPAMASVAIEGSKSMYRSTHIEVENVFEMAGKNNFLVVDVENEGNDLSIKANIYYGKPNDDELQCAQIDII